MVSKKEKKLAESVKSLELRVTKRKAPPPSVLFWVFDIGDRRVGDNGMSRDCIGRGFIHGNRSTLTQQSYGAQGKAILYTLYMFMHTTSLGENTHREQCRFSNKRFFGKGSTTENRESRHKVHREMHPFEQKEENKTHLNYWIHSER